MSNDKPGKLIIINGACSVGKTSCAKALQNILPDDRANILLGIDTFHLAIPSNKLMLGHGDPNYLLANETCTADGIETEILHGAYMQQINKARYLAITHFLQQSIDVIADEIFWRTTDLLPFLTALKDYQVYIIGMHTKQNIADEREQARSANKSNAKDDYRPTGMHRASRKTDEFMSYDLRIDSSRKNSNQCAAEIAYWIRHKPKLTAFQSLCDNYLTP